MLHATTLRTARRGLGPASTRACTLMRSFSASAPARLMDSTILNDSQVQVREAVAELCAGFGDPYWRERDATATYPFEFHRAMADGGWLGIALPERFGGSGLGMLEAAAMMQMVTESGGGFPSAQCTHANVFATQPLSIFGTDEQCSHYIPRIVSGEYRTTFAVTEPDVGLNTLEMKTMATQRPDGQWSIKGQKIWITNAQNAHVMILLARTTPLDQVKKKSEGLSCFIIPVDKEAPGLEMRKIRKMGGNCVDSNQIFFDDYVVPEDSIIGGIKNKDKGFKVILHGMNAERIIIGAEALGIGYAAVGRFLQDDLLTRSSTRPQGTPLSASCSAGQSARTRVLPIRWPTRTCRSTRRRSQSTTQRGSTTSRRRTRASRRSLSAQQPTRQSTSRPRLLTTPPSAPSSRTAAWALRQSLTSSDTTVRAGCPALLPLAAR